MLNGRLYVIFKYKREWFYTEFLICNTLIYQIYKKVCLYKVAECSSDNEKVIKFDRLN